MKKTNTYLELHERLLEKGVFTLFFTHHRCGLCGTEFKGGYLSKDVDFEFLFLYGHKSISKGHNYLFWGSESEEAKRGEYTPLRQNIVLLLAAINGEL